MERSPSRTIARLGLLATAGAVLSLAAASACGSDESASGQAPSLPSSGGGGASSGTAGHGADGGDAGAGGDAPSCGDGPSLAGSFEVDTTDAVIDAQAPATVYRFVDVEHDPRSGVFAASYVLGIDGYLRTALNTVAVDGAPSPGARITVEDDGFCASCNSGPMDLSFASGPGTSLGLLLFVDDRASGGNGLLEIRGQFVSVAPGGGAPTLIGPNVDVSETPDTGDDAPAVVYEPMAARFMAFWSDDRDAMVHPGEDRRVLFGRSVGTDGSLGAAFRVADDARWQVGANAAAGAGRVVVVWTDYLLDGPSLAIGVRARFVDAAASAIAGPILELHRPGGFQTDAPAIAYDDRSCRFLVAWAETDGPEGMQIAGALLDATGAIVRERFLLASREGGAGAPRLAYHHATRSFLLTYHAWDIYDAYALEIGPDGTPAGEPVSIHATLPTLGTFFQPVAAGPGPSFLVASLEDYARIDATLLVAPAEL